MIFAEIQEADGEKLLVIRVVAPKDPNQEIPDEVPKFNIYIDESWNTRDYITPALTDITNRTFTEDQITLMSPCDSTPNHLTVVKIKKIEAAHAATNPSETLVLVTAEPDEKDEYLTVLNTRTGREFKVNNQIEMTDALNDFIKPLKMKTLSKVQIKITLAALEGTIEPVDKATQVQKEGSNQSIILNDLVSGESRINQFVLKGAISGLTYEYEDLLLSRRVSGGIRLE
jgi:hypothetical protein